MRKVYKGKNLEQALGNAIVDMKKYGYSPSNIRKIGLGFQKSGESFTTKTLEAINNEVLSGNAPQLTLSLGKKLTGDELANQNQLKELSVFKELERLFAEIQIEKLF